MGTFQLLGINDLQRQVNLAFGYTTQLTFQVNITYFQSLSTDIQLVQAISSKLATRVWFGDTENNIPLVEVTLMAHHVPSELVGLAVGGDQAKQFIWQLASRTSGDHLAKVDVRLDRILFGPKLQKEDVGTEVPRGLTTAGAASFSGDDVNIHTFTRKATASPVSPSDVLVGILIDNYSKYMEQSIRWLVSFQKNLINDTSKQDMINVLVCILPDVPATFIQFVQEKFGSFITIRYIQPLKNDLPNATPHSNKLKFLEQPECNSKSTLYQPFIHNNPNTDAKYQYCIYMDTDILILNNDLLSYINPDQSTIQFRAGRTLWAQTASKDPSWFRMFELAGVMREGKDSYPLASVWPNTGLLIFPTSIIPLFVFNWIHYTDKTMIWLTTFKQDVYFTETISFLLAMLMTKNIQYELLPIQMNTQMNLPLFDFKRNGYINSLATSDVTILHYPLNTLVMDDIYHVPQEYRKAEILQFPFLLNVNKQLFTMKIKMHQIMMEWKNYNDDDGKTCSGTTCHRKNGENK
jgi:hypothetical protein